MTTLRTQIVTEIVTALNTDAPSGFPVASRLRLHQLENEELPAISVFPVRDVVQPATNRPGPLVLRELAITVEVRISGDDPDVLLDPYVARVEQVLARYQGVSIDVHDCLIQSVDYEFAQRAQMHGAAAVQAIVHYQSRRDDPERAQ
jgi:hypothetical protein